MFDRYSCQTTVWDWAVMRKSVMVENLPWLYTHQSCENVAITKTMKCKRRNDFHNLARSISITDIQEVKIVNNDLNDEITGHLSELEVISYYLTVINCYLRLFLNIHNITVTGFAITITYITDCTITITDIPIFWVCTTLVTTLKSRVSISYSLNLTFILLSGRKKVIVFQHVSVDHKISLAIYT